MNQTQKDEQKTMGLDNVWRYLWTKSPQDYWKRACGAKEAYRPWAKGKQIQWNRLPFYLQMFKACAERAGHTLRFDGQRVLEIGPGQVLGLIPFALLEGAIECGIVELTYRDIRDQRGFQDEYLYPLFQLYNQVLGKSEAGSFADFVAGVQRVHIEGQALEDIESPTTPYNIVLSKSCLEHIADLPRAVKSSHTISAPGSLHIHYVDFSMHYARHQLSGNVFGHTYQQARSENPEYLTSPGGIVNLLRPSDVLATFRDYFSEVQFFPSVDYRDRIAMLNLATRHPDWRRYDESDLSVAHGVVVAVR